MAASTDTPTGDEQLFAVIRRWRQSFSHPLRLGQYSPSMQAVIRVLEKSCLPDKCEPPGELKDLWSYLQWIAECEYRQHKRMNSNI